MYPGVKLVWNQSVTNQYVCPWLYFLCIRPHKSLQTSLNAQHAPGNFPWRVLGSDPADQHGIRPPQVLPTQILGISEIPDKDELLLFEWWTLLHLSSAADWDWGSYGSVTSALVEKPLRASSDTVSIFPLPLCSLSISCNVPSRLILADTNHVSESTECWASYQKNIACPVLCAGKCFVICLFISFWRYLSCDVPASQDLDGLIGGSSNHWGGESGSVGSQCYPRQTKAFGWFACETNTVESFKNRVQNNLKDQNILSHPGGWR